jgi:hypothetical protein
MLPQMQMILAALLLGFLSDDPVPPPIPEPEPPRRPVPTLKYRQHYTLHDSDGVLLYEYTVIHDLSEKRMAKVTLVRDPGHGDVLLHDSHTIADKRSSHRISDVKDRVFVESSFDMPYAAATFSALFKEVFSQVQVAEIPTLLTFRTNGGEWKEIDTKLSNEHERRRLRHAIRQTMDPYLLEAIERMRGTFFRTSEGKGVFTLFVTFLVYDSQTDPPMDAVAKMQNPACDFDDSFGYPCTSEQLNRIRDARAAGKEMVHY